MSRRVALFSTTFCDYSQTFVYDEFRSHKRYDVEVFCRETRNLERLGVPPSRIHQPRTRWSRQLYMTTRYSSEFHRQFLARRYDIVHAHFGTGAVYAYPYARRYRLPFVVTLHGYDVALLRSRQRFHPGRWQYLLSSRGIFRDASLVLCASAQLADMISEYGARPDRVRVYRLGVDLDRFHKGPAQGDVPRVLMIGRFVEKKGFEYGFRAFSRVVHGGQPATLTLVGTGELERSYRRLVSDLRLEPHVSFSGVLTPDQVAQELATTDVLLAPSCTARNGDLESGLLVAKEAGAASVPVIGSRHGGIPEIVEDGITGYLVPERDERALADRLGSVLADPALRARLGASARTKMEKEYNLRRQVAMLESLYDLVLA
ncbi:MAG: glycosyltransferase [Polyangiaceae bacterium]|nr:glycosyltransferase [Polyangiaceae bacterium]